MKKYIACFDSGIGGITTLMQARKLLPGENFIYYADTVHVPYGGREPAEVRALTHACVKDMLPWGLKALLLACNAATSAGAAELRSELDIPVLGVEPAIKPALAAVSGPVVMLSTELTARGEKFRRLMAELPGGERVIPVGCPGLADLIEQDPRHPELEAYILRLLAPYAKELQALVLGCTHYVFLRPLLARLYPQIPLFDGNEGVARQLARLLPRQAVENRGEILWMCAEKEPGAEICFAARCQSYYEFCEREGL